MTITKETIDYIARLAKLSFTSEEKKELIQEFDEILTHFDALNEEDLKGVFFEAKATTQSKARPDQVVPFSHRKRLFKNAKAVHKQYIKIPKILD